MAEPNSRPTPCPRCGAPIMGAFKFCPTCAYRIQGPEDSAEIPAAGGTRWPAALAGGLFLLLVVAVVFLGVVIFHDEPTNGRVVPGPEPEPPRGRLTVRDHVADVLFSETLPPGWAANISPNPEVQKYVAVPNYGSMLIFEVTRGMYAEFLEDLLKRRTEGEPWPRYLQIDMEALWRPAPTKDEKKNEEHRAYTNRYIDVWWAGVERHLRSLDLTPRRPPDLEAPLPTAYDVLLLVPPSWFYLTGFEELAWRLPPGTENLPITEVSWYEAVAFSAWVNDLLDIESRLPQRWEWMRAGSGGKADRRYPWGDDPFFQACNSLNHWGTDDQLRLRPVDYRYSDHPGLSPEKLYAMSGNAREWCLNSPDPESTEPIDEPDFPDAPTCGGSFRMGIEDCEVTPDSVIWQDKIDRLDDLGFRLWMDVGRP